MKLRASTTALLFLSSRKGGRAIPTDTFPLFPSGFPLSKQLAQLCSFFKHLYAFEIRIKYF